MGQDDPPNYDTATLVAVPLDGLEPLKHLAAFQVRFSTQLSPTQLKYSRLAVDVKTRKRI